MRIHPVLIGLLLLANGSGLLAQGRRTPTFGEYARKIAEATRESDWVEGERAATGALSMRPNDPELLFHRAYFRARRGRAVEAAGDLNRVADLGLTLPVKRRFQTFLDDERIAAVQARYDKLAAPQGDARLLTQGGPADLGATTLLYDPIGKRHLLGGRNRPEVWQIDAAGKASILVKRSEGGLWSVGAMVIDPELRLLWCASTARKGMPGAQASVVGRAGLFAFSLETGKLAHSILVPSSGGKRDLTGLVRLSRDRLIASCARSGELLAFDRKTRTVSTLVRRGFFSSPQALVLSESGKWLIASDEVGPLRRVNTRSGEVTAMRQGPHDCLYRVRDLALRGRVLYALQTGYQPVRLLALRLDPSFSSIVGRQVLLSNDSRFDRPRGLAVVDDAIRCVANTRVAKAATSPQILSLKLK
jgi:hypothetical protein